MIFCPFREAVEKHPELIKKYLATVVPYRDNYYAALNSAVFSDSSFVYIPPGVRCPMELSTYFRINAMNTGQFERTLIIADKHSHVSYLEGCTAPMRDETNSTLRAVELVTGALKSNMQRYKIGIQAMKTVRVEFIISSLSVHWQMKGLIQIETGSAITWKYSVVLGRYAAAFTP